MIPNFITSFLLIGIGFSQGYTLGETISSEHQSVLLPVCANGNGFISLRDYNGDLNEGNYSITLISTFASWCTTCLEEVPLLSQIYDSQMENGLKVIALGREWDYPYSCEEWAGLGATYPLINDDSLMIWAWFGFGYIPQNIILDHTMTVRYSAIGFNQTEISDIVDLLLSELPIASNEPKLNLPASYKISSVYPNPFNPTASINIKLKQLTNVNLIIRNISGKIIDTKLYNNLTIGENTLIWKSNNTSSGIYFFQIKTPNWTHIKKGVLLK